MLQTPALEPSVLRRAGKAGSRTIPGMCGDALRKAGVSATSPPRARLAGQQALRTYAEEQRKKLYRILANYCCNCINIGYFFGGTATTPELSATQDLGRFIIFN